MVKWGGETGGETGDDEKGKELDQPLNLWLPVDSWGNQYGDTDFDENDIVGIRYRPHYPKEGEGEEFEREANRLGDQWTAAQGTGGEKPDDPTKDPEPGYGQVRGADGEIYDKNPNGWKDPNRPSSGLIDRYNSSTWSSSASWDNNISDLTRDGLPTGHPQHENNRPNHLKPPEGSPGGGGIFAEPFIPTNAQIESAARDAGAPSSTRTLFSWTIYVDNVPITEQGYFNVPTSISGSGRNFRWEYDYNNAGAPQGARPAYGERYGGTFTVDPPP